MTGDKAINEPGRRQQSRNDSAKRPSAIPRQSRSGRTNARTNLEPQQTSPSRTAPLPTQITSRDGSTTIVKD
eukprot:scaffold21309_cov46-Prasinocladus_malaysianus.AAC.2